jgi:hypothetical protein
MAEPIEDLLEEIEHKEIVLPEFQREFKWNRDQVRSLFESLYKGYPTGSLLVWITDNPPKIKHDAYDLDKVRRVKVLLDGQQRLTSLYLHIYGQVPPYYTPDEIGDGYLDLYFNLKSGAFRYYRKLEMQGDPLWMKLNDLFSNPPSVFSLVNSLGIEDAKAREELGQAIEQNLVRLKQIPKREYPVQAVPSEATVREAITVFDLINSQGTPLSQSDIVLAYMTAEWPDIRRVFKEKLTQLESANFAFDLTFLTRCMVGVTEGVGDLTRFGEPPESQLKEGWHKLERALDYLLSFLHHKAYIIGDKDLNTQNVLVPLVVYLARYGWFTQADESRFLHWAYAALYQRHYTGSVDTTLDRDIQALLEQPGPDALLANLKEDEGDPTITAASLDMRGVGNPLYNMMSIVIRARGAVDWANGLPLVTTGSNNFRIDRHHIFPSSVLVAAGWDTGTNQYARKRVHEIANRIPLTQAGNLEIFDRPPSEYLPIVEERYPGNLERSMIPMNPKLWEVDRYEDFLAQRRMLIADAINEHIEGLLQGPEAAGRLDLPSLIAQEEGPQLEFKARFHGGHGDYRLETATTKAVAGMLNAEGGKLLLGVKDDGQVIGIEADYRKQGKQNRDGFAIELTNELGAKLGANALPLIQIYFATSAEHDVCIVEIDRSSKPVYMQEEGVPKFYVRMQNSTRPLDVEQATDYIKDHFH